METEDYDRMRREVEEITLIKAEIKDLKEVNARQDKKIKSLEAILSRYDKLANRAWGLALGVFLAGVSISSGWDRLRELVTNGIFK